MSTSRRQTDSSIRCCCESRSRYSPVQSACVAPSKCCHSEQRVRGARADAEAKRIVIRPSPFPHTDPAGLHPIYTASATPWDRSASTLPSPRRAERGHAAASRSWRMSGEQHDADLARGSAGDRRAAWSVVRLVDCGSRGERGLCISEVLSHDHGNTDDGERARRT
jgi:hypothetical protein